MAQIFVSYSRKDAKIVDRLISELDKAGHKVWIDRAGIRGGEQWRQQIVTAIDDSDFLLLILSPNSIKSDNVRKELDLAEGVKKRVLPIVVKPIKDIPKEMRYQLVGLQRLDLSDDFEAGFGQLLEALEDTDYIESRIPDSVHKPRNITRIVIISVVLFIVVLVFLTGILTYLLPNRDEIVAPPGDTGEVPVAVEQSSTQGQAEDKPEVTTNLQMAIETALAETRQAEAKTIEVIEPPSLTPTAPIPSPTATQLPQSDISTTTPSPTPFKPIDTPTPEPPAIPTPDLSLVIDDFEGFSGPLDDGFAVNRNAGNEGQINLIGIPHVNEGRQALAFVFDIRHSPPDNYIGFDRTLPPQDWSNFTSLCFWVESDGSNRSLILQFGESKLKFWKKIYSLSNGTGDYCISLNDPHQINMSSISYYGVYVEGPPTGQSIIYIDNIRLVN